MKNCIFCIFRDINEKTGNPGCLSKKGIPNTELPTRMKYIDVDTNLKCEGFKENELSGIFNRLNSGISNAFKILENGE